MYSLCYLYLILYILFIICSNLTFYNNLFILIMKLLLQIYYVKIGLRSRKLEIVFSMKFKRCGIKKSITYSIRIIYRYISKSSIWYYVEYM